MMVKTNSLSPPSSPEAGLDGSEQAERLQERNPMRTAKVKALFISLNFNNANVMNFRCVYKSPEGLVTGISSESQPVAHSMTLVAILAFNSRGLRYN